jgi:hypothetical protein
MLNRIRSSQPVVLQASTWIAANPAAVRVAVAVLALAVAAGSMLFTSQPVSADLCTLAGGGC